jgi:hypothetical protein
MLVENETVHVQVMSQYDCKPDDKTILIRSLTSLQYVCTNKQNYLRCILVFYSISIAPFLEHFIVSLVDNFCIAKLSPSSSPRWAKLALVSLDPAPQRHTPTWERL